MNDNFNINAKPQGGNLKDAFLSKFPSEPPALPVQATVAEPLPESGYFPMPIEPARPTPDTVEPDYCIAGIMRQYLGKTVKLECLVGDTIITKIGTLMGVGSTYVTLQLYNTNALVICDLFTIKFVTVLDGYPNPTLYADI